MKRYLISMLAFCMMTGMALAQTEVGTTVIDDFESYADTGAMTTAWNLNTGYSTLSLGTTGGADATAKSLHISDGGYSMLVGATAYTGKVTTAGFYKLRFSYKNGATDAPQDQLKVTFVYNTGDSQVVNIANSVVSAWTQVETPIVAIAAGSDITLTVGGQHNAALVQTCDFDQFVLVQMSGLPMTMDVRPFDGYYVSGTQTIKALAVGGTAPLTVTFDVNNDGSVEGTDTTAPYEFAWDTSALGTTAQEAVALKVTATDSAGTPEVVTVTNTYTVDNRDTGREELITNGGFEDWPAPATIPTGWVEFMADADGNISAASTAWTRGEGADAKVGSYSLKVTTTTQPDPFRYTVRSVDLGTGWDELLLWFWGKGAWARMFYFTSLDGVAWTSTAHAVVAGTTVWSEQVDSAPYGTAEGQIQNTHWAVATHIFGDTQTCLFDEVSVTARQVPVPPPPLGATQWNLYE